MEDLLTEFGDLNWRDADRPLVQMVDDWHRFPDTREQFLASVPPGDANSRHLLKIAAVLHALCDYSGLPVPDWVYRWRTDRPFALFHIPLDSDYAEMVYRESPPACEYHGVWFEKGFVCPKRHGLVSPLEGMTQEEFFGMINVIDAPEWARVE